jgi:hypothetical protein
MHGVNIATSAAERIACRLPECRFLRRPDQCLQTRCQPCTCRSPIPGTAFRSPRTAAPLDASIPRSTFPACPFGSPTGFLPARSALQLHNRFRFAPAATASMPRTRCRFSTDRRQPSKNSHSPSGPLHPSGSPRRLSSNQRTHLPVAPDSRSLPAAILVR